MVSAPTVVASRSRWIVDMVDCDEHAYDFIGDLENAKWLNNDQGGGTIIIPIACTNCGQSGLQLFHHDREIWDDIE
jgi:hypothetical protein